MYNHFLNVIYLKENFRDKIEKFLKILNFTSRYVPNLLFSKWVYFTSVFFKRKFDS